VPRSGSGSRPTVFREALLDADGTLVETTGQCKEGMDITYKSIG